MAKTQRLGALLKKMAALPEAARKEIGQALEQGGQEIMAAQKRLAPKRTGALARSIAMTKGGANLPKYAAFGSAGNAANDLSIAISAGNAGVRYAHLVEFGTAPHIAGGLFEGAQHPGAKPHAFFYPAYRAYKRRVKGRVTRAAKKSARSVAAGG